MDSLSKGAAPLRLHRTSRAVLGAVQKRGPLSKNDILRQTGLKLTTLTRFLQPLLEAGLIAESDFAPSSGGRRPLLYEADCRRYALLGVDISRTYTQVVLTNLRMEVLGRRRFSMTAAETPERLLRRIPLLASELLAERPKPSPALLLCGVGAVGPLDPAAGVIAAPRHFEAPGWRDIPVAAALGEALGCPVTLDNGVSAAALCEALYGIGKGAGNVAYVNCGVGIRLGAFLGGAPLRAPRNAEDAFGHMVIDADGPLCACGRRGCLDCFASLHAVAEAYAARTGGGPAGAYAEGFGKIFDEAQRGEEPARAVVLAAAEYLGVGLGNLAGLLAPGAVILAGPMAERSALFYETAANAARRSCASSGGAVGFYRGGRYGGDAIAAGAAALALENLLQAK